MRLVGHGHYVMKYKGLSKATPEHRLVLHRVDPRPNEDELVVHHIDGNKSNNEPSNLVWMTNSEHVRLHRLGENHFPCDGRNNANYRHGMCVGGSSKEYVHIKNHEDYMRHHDKRLAQQNAYGAEHREHKRWYDKLRHWKEQLEKAVDQDRINECLERIKHLEENPQ